jgi:hypothetical protein
MNWLRKLLGLTDEAERRYYLRSRTFSKLRIEWRDRHGKIRRKRVRVLDMSGDGAAVKCATFLEPGSMVYVRTPELGIMGSAYVRHCHPLLFSYHIGLQFAVPVGSRY